MAKTRLQRRTLGAHFNEGARQSWIALEKRAWTVSQLAEAVGRTQGSVHRVLHGDVVPGLKMATLLEKILGVRCPLWLLPPKNHFVPPAARAA